MVFKWNSKQASYSKRKGRAGTITMSSMKALAGLAMGAMIPMLAMELKVDHVTVAGRNLEALVKAFAAIGLEAEYGGKHTNGMTEMAIASFTDGSYLELIAEQPGASAAKHDWGRFIEHDGGVCAWAVAVTDIGAEEKRLR